MFVTFYNPNNQRIIFNIQPPKFYKYEYKTGFNFGTYNYLYSGKTYNGVIKNNRKKNYIYTSKYIPQNTGKNKKAIKIVIYQNGFIVNNGQFRDKSNPVNMNFLREIEKGNIPNELLKKGIIDFEILLENRKNQIYHLAPKQNLNYNLGKSNASYNTTTFQYRTPKINPYYINNNYKENNGQKLPNRKMTNTFVVNSQMIGRNKKPEPLFNTNTVNVNNTHNVPKILKRTNSFEKEKKEPKFVEFLEFQKENDNKKNKKNEIKTEGRNKFKPFSGYGKSISNISLEGLYINKNVNTMANFYNPICQINIRLFNGEVIKAPFNYDQTLTDVYNYVNKVSGSNNFVLLEGFPPKEIPNYGLEIYLLGLQNSVITQKIR